MISLFKSRSAIKTRGRLALTDKRQSDDLYDLNMKNKWIQANIEHNFNTLCHFASLPFPIYYNHLSEYPDGADGEKIKQSNLILEAWEAVASSIQNMSIGVYVDLLGRYKLSERRFYLPDEPRQDLETEIYEVSQCPTFDYENKESNQNIKQYEWRYSEHNQSPEKIELIKFIQRLCIKHLIQVDFGYLEGVLDLTQLRSMNSNRIYSSAFEPTLASHYHRFLTDVFLEYEYTLPPRTLLNLFPSYDDQDFIFMILSRCSNPRLFTEIVKSSFSHELPYRTGLPGRELFPDQTDEENLLIINKMKEHGLWYTLTRWSYMNFDVEFGKHVDILNDDRLLEHVSSIPLEYINPEIINRVIRTFDFDTNLEILTKVALSSTQIECITFRTLVMIKRHEMVELLTPKDGKTVKIKTKNLSGFNIPDVIDLPNLEFMLACVDKDLTKVPPIPNYQIAYQKVKFLDETNNCLHYALSYLISRKYNTAHLDTLRSDQLYENRDQDNSSFLINLSSVSVKDTDDLVLGYLHHGRWRIFSGWPVKQQIKNSSKFEMYLALIK